ncbi:hypothetical protein [Streptomyces sp. wa1063]|uniref:hypothetical protein n=1 Tax=Streptomyces sp. wa1063 TaxID=1828212 RepID=UPI000BEFA966|nr:hypothetical protein [Streptomyces sp. wa1063]
MSELDHLLDRAERNTLLIEEGARLRELVAHLVAGQCTDQLAVCQTHHALPVAGCPYPRCAAARNRDQRAPVAPAEHCGDQPSEVFTWLHPGQYAECVLRPGHQGSHADQHGMRWWLATEQPQASPAEGGQHPFEQNPAAPASVHVCRCGKWPDHHTHTGSTVACGCDTCRATA